MPLIIQNQSLDVVVQRFYGDTKFTTSKNERFVRIVLSAVKALAISEALNKVGCIKFLRNNFLIMDELRQQYSEISLKDAKDIVEYFLEGGTL